MTPLKPPRGRMTLVFSGNDYVHKVLVVAAEAGVLDRIDFVVNNPVENGAAIWDYTPLGRHPVLVLGDGLVLYSGLLSCEYLDSLQPDAERRLFPQGEKRWRALAQMALGDGLFDAVSALSVAALRPTIERDGWAMRRDRDRVMGALVQMQEDARNFVPGDLHIGHVCFAGGLSFLDRRRPLEELRLVPEDEVFDWRRRHAVLADWYEHILDRPSMRLRPKDLGVIGTERQLNGRA